MSNLKDNPYMSQSNAVGQGFNVYGQFDISSMIKPLFDFSEAPTQTFTFCGKDYTIPTLIIALEDTKSDLTVDVFESSVTFQDKLATHAGVDVSFGAFSGEINVDFNTDSKSSSAYNYGYLANYHQLGYLQLNDEATPFLTNEFKVRLSSLPDKVDTENAVQFFEFFNEFGAYYISKIMLGGLLNMCVTVTKSSQLDSSSFSASLNAQYKGLFASGSIDTSITSTKQWETYKSSSKINVITRGGQPSLTTALQGVDVFSPSDSSVNLFVDWTKSLESDPAIYNFELSGIWNLCDEKRQVVRDAWEIFGKHMHPKLSIVTSSVSAGLKNLPAPTSPTVILAGQQLVPKHPAKDFTGYQLIIVDNTRVTQPEGILLNKYYTVPNSPNWMENYTDMYDNMYNDIDDGKYNDPKYIIILVSFGLDYNMPPTNQFFGLLISSGAGEILKDWETKSDPGSQNTAGNWNTFPTIYILVGQIQSGSDEGVEFIHGFTSNYGTHSASLDINFYKQTYDGTYVIELG